MEWTNKNAVIYIRVSSDTQMQKWNWLKSQETSCWMYAKSKWINVVEIFQDWWISGRKKDRDGLNAMIEYLKTKNKYEKVIDYVIVDDIDRLSRNTRYWLEIQDVFKDECKIEILSLKQIIDENSPESNLLVTITMSVKQYEAENNARRTKSRQTARLMDWYFTYYPPSWYRYIDNPHWAWKILVLDEPRASFLKEALTLFSEWYFNNLVELADYLFDIWFRTKKAKNKVYVSYVQRIVTNKDMLLMYAWYINMPELWVEMVKWKHQALISLDMVDKIIDQHAKLSKTFYKTNTKKSIADHMFLRWFATCPECGKLLTWWPCKNRHWNTYYYYECNNSECSLYWRWINAEKLHKSFYDVLDWLKLKPWTLSLYEKMFADMTKNSAELEKKSKSENLQRIKSIDTKIDKYKNNILETNEPEAMKTYSEAIWKLKYEKEKILNWWNSPKKEIDMTTLWWKAKELLENPIKIWKIWDTHARRDLIKALFGWRVKISENNRVEMVKEIPIYDVIGRLK